ncbi:isochorismate-pyruvate lyase [Pedobacter sp. KBW06]|uniref:isochorismate lyase n=1 Tax=Pedobacter sp. KBW06 TaxID=2153359 RepID=UPI000F5A1B46|nr:isochorismate lyase [Pedobacter sp. KBW06]RQO74851.1 isochorismate-pyruvate lyase [Pedobacter sp. KBW06]
MKNAAACENMEEIRGEIDQLDKQVIHLIGQRYKYVQAAAKFKKDENSVKAPERFKSMLEKRREWAIQEGLSPDAIEKMFRDLVNYFISEELKTWKKEGSS